MKTLYEEFSWRGLVSAATEGLSDVLAKEHVTAYIGFDPTDIEPACRLAPHRDGPGASSAVRHSPIAIVGGRHGMIGDPSGKSQERQLLTLTRSTQRRGIRSQLSRLSRLRRAETIRLDS